MLAYLKSKGLTPGKYSVDNYDYSELKNDYNNPKAKLKGGTTTADFRGEKVTTTVTMAPHLTKEGFMIDLGHELIHAYDYHHYGPLWIYDIKTREAQSYWDTPEGRSYLETRAYMFSDLYKDYSTLPSKYEPYHGPLPLLDIPDYINFKFDPRQFK